MTGAIPDPLRRFARTPFEAIVRRCVGDLHIETDDRALTEELAERLRAAEETGLLRAFMNVKVIVENSLSDSGSEIVRVDAGEVRVLLRGTSTILMHDGEAKELLAFLNVDVTAAELVDRLIPALLGGPLTAAANFGITKV